MTKDLFIVPPGWLEIALNDCMTREDSRIFSNGIWRIVEDLSSVASHHQDLPGPEF
jgi:hypothetical protein